MDAVSVYWPVLVKLARSDGLKALQHKAWAFRPRNSPTNPRPVRSEANVGSDLAGISSFPPMALRPTRAGDESGRRLGFSPLVIRSRRPFSSTDSPLHFVLILSAVLVLSCSVSFRSTRAATRMVDDSETFYLRSERGIEPRWRPFRPRPPTPPNTGLKPCASCCRAFSPVRWAVSPTARSLGVQAQE